MGAPDIASPLRGDSTLLKFRFRSDAYMFIYLPSLEHLDEVIEACPVGGRIHAQVMNMHVAEGWERLVQWPQVNFEGLTAPVGDEWPRILVLTQQTTNVTVMRIQGDGLSEVQEAAGAYAEENWEAHQEMILRG
jgi:hypothetical protein